MVGKGNRGVVLLLTLMVLSILVVVVGEFATTAVLDWKIERNRERECQLFLDLRSGAEGAMQFLASKKDSGDEGEGALAIHRETSDIEVSIEDESGKFNINSLLAPPKGVSPQEAEAVLRRLLSMADDPAGTLPQGLADGIVGLLQSSQTPLPTLGALLEIDGVTRDMLWGGEDGGGGLLGSILTVAGDGRIRPGAGEDMVLLSLSENLDPNVIEAFLDFLEEPGGVPPAALAKAAGDVLPWITWESRYFTAVVSARRKNSLKTARFGLEETDAGPVILCYDEIR